MVISERLAQRTGFTEGDTLTEAYVKALPGQAQQDLANQLNRRTEFKVLEGPTTIIIRRDIIERAIEGPDRQSLPQEAPGQGAAPVTPVQDTISDMSTLYGKSPEEIAGLPVLQFEQRSLDLGAVKQGDKRTFTYTFTNTGRVAGQIMLIQACECTSVEHDNSIVYAPGDSGILTVTFDSESKSDPETLGIDVFLEQSDANGRPVIELVEYSFEIEE